MRINIRIFCTLVLAGSIHVQAYVILSHFTLLCFVDITLFYNQKFVATLCGASLLVLFSQ